MNKRTFMWILQVALLSYDGVSSREMVDVYQINPIIVKAGIKLCDYLKSINVLEGGKNG